MQNVGSHDAAHLLEQLCYALVSNPFHGYPHFKYGSKPRAKLGSQFLWALRGCNGYRHYTNAYKKPHFILRANKLEVSKQIFNLSLLYLRGLRNSVAS